MKGDILLVCYMLDPIAWLIRRVTHSKWNHVAWFIDNDNIIEVRGRGIIISSAERYIKNKTCKYKIIRLKDISPLKLKKAINSAIKEEKQSSWFKWLWSVILIWADYSKTLPRKTCSGFIAIALSTVDFTFNLKKEPYKITPEDINYSKRTENVK